MAQTLTSSDVLAEMAVQHAAMAANELPDMRAVARMLTSIDINAPCEATGLTPLLWAIENDSALFHFCLARGADANARGGGDFALAPIDLAVARGQMERASRLVRGGAQCPPEVAAYLDAMRAEVARHEKEIKDAERTLERGLKDAAFLAVAEELATTLGVPVAKIRGRKGHLSFKAAPVKKLAAAAAMDQGAWLASVQAKAADAGAWLFSRTLLWETARQELCLAPTTQMRQIVAISALLTREGGMSHTRMAKADVLDALNADHPFRLLTCGPLGVAGLLETLPEDLPAFASRLLDLCPELHADAEIQLDEKRPPGSLGARGTPDELAAVVAKDITGDGVFWLPWGVDF